MNSVSIGGSIYAGSDTLTASAAISANLDIGSLTVKGGLIGNHNEHVTISAIGPASPGVTDIAMGAITIGGRVDYTDILAGYGITRVAANGDAQVGTVKVGGNWSASNLIVGAQNIPSINIKFGDANDTLIPGGSPGILASVASIISSGHVYGTSNDLFAVDHFGFVAELFSFFSAGGVVYANNPPAHAESLSLVPTHDVTLHEI